MAEVRPFRAVRYADGLDLADRVALALERALVHEELMRLDQVRGQTRIPPSPLG
jgi:hypothetical protein